MTAVGLRRDSTVDLPDGVDGGTARLWVISQGAQARGCGFVADGPEHPYDEVERAGPKEETVVGQLRRVLKRPLEETAQRFRVVLNEASEDGASWPRRCGASDGCEGQDGLLRIE